VSKRKDRDTNKEGPARTRATLRKEPRERDARENGEREKQRAVTPEKESKGKKGRERERRGEKGREEGQMNGEDGEKPRHGTKEWKLK